MQYYQVLCVDNCTLRGLYTSKKEAEKAAKWYEEHQYPYQCEEYSVIEAVPNEIESEFIPPMSEEEWEHEMRVFGYGEDNYGEDN